VERTKNEAYKGNNGVKGKSDIIDIIEKKRLQWYRHVKRITEDKIPKLIMEWIPEERRKRGRPKNVHGRSTNSHDSKKFRTRSVEKQGGMAFGFRKTETVAIKPDR
jgi:Tfp pilus assembly pilus retraction ATPase PilT